MLDNIDAALRRQNIAYHVIVVDDGSVDRTAAAVENYRDQLTVTLCRHEINPGLGSTIRDVLRIASGMASGEDVVVTMDADETHIPGLIPRMLQLICEAVT